MRRLILLTLPVAACMGGWSFLERYKIEHGPGGYVVRARGEQRPAPPDAHAWPTPGGSTVRIASINLDPLGEAKLEHPEIARLLAQIVRRFDVLAVQGIRADSSDVLAGFVAQLNGDGARYSYVLGPRVGPPGRQQQFAYLFNAERVDADRDSAYAIEDPDDLLTYEPLAVPFSVRASDGTAALTWTAINCLVEPAAAQRELPALGRAYRAVRDDGRNEDDIVMLGDFGADVRAIDPLVAIPYATCALSAGTSNVRHTALTENIVFDRRATIEFTGHVGVFDFPRQFKLNTAEALELGQQLPIYADFYIGEGARRGTVAAPPLGGALR